MIRGTNCLTWWKEGLAVPNVNCGIQQTRVQKIAFDSCSIRPFYKLP
jgi:hypothetical protein